MSPKIDPKTLKELPALLFPAHTKTEEAVLTWLRTAKKIRKIGPRLYTSIEKTADEKELIAIVQMNWAQIVSQLYPKAVLSHRSALEFKPSQTHQIILTGTTNRRVQYPGIILEFVRGPAALPDDLPFIGLHASSRARAFLENLSSTKKSFQRTLPKIEIEMKLEEILSAQGEEEINRIRDRAKSIAHTFGWMTEYKKLNQLIGALLGTRSRSQLTSDVARARASGRPFDAMRVSRFNLLAAALLATPLKELKDQFNHKLHFKNKAFFEAYFSNFIEGTTFEIHEAEEIIFMQKKSKHRPKDAHDILETFNISSDPNEMKKTPKTAKDLEDLIKQRHYKLMQYRSEIRPGEFKEITNRAGDTQFVEPSKVFGTLEKGIERYLDLPEGVARAIFMMFLISEVHPFIDGNGRIARITMNAELHSRGLTTIIIPTVYREDYLLALRSLTRRDRPEPLIKMLTRAHCFSHLDFGDYKNTLVSLQEKNWFREPDEAMLIDHSNDPRSHA